MNPLHEQAKSITRRHFFGRTGMGLGAIALHDLLAREANAAAPADKQPHFAPKAKAVISRSSQR